MQSTEVVTRRSPARLPRNVIWLSVVSFLNDFSSEMIYPLLPVFFIRVLGATPAALGAMEGLVESTASLVKLYSGRLGDRLPRRKPLVVAGYSLASVTRPFLALAMAPWHVIGLRVVDRVGKGLRSAPRDALIADSVDPAHHGRAFFSGCRMLPPGALDAAAGLRFGLLEPDATRGGIRAGNRGRAALRRDETGGPAADAAPSATLGGVQ